MGAVCLGLLPFLLVEGLLRVCGIGVPSSYEDPWGGQAIVNWTFIPEHIVPDRARVEVGRAGVTVGDMRIRGLEDTGAPEDAPTIRLNVKSTAGEISAR